MSKLKLFFLSLIILIIGGINWGLVGVFSFDLVATMFGKMSILSRIIYSLVGVSAIIAAITAPKQN